MLCLLATGGLRRHTGQQAAHRAAMVASKAFLAVSSAVKGLVERFSPLSSSTSICIRGTTLTLPWKSTSRPSLTNKLKSGLGRFESQGSTLDAALPKCSCNPMVVSQTYKTAQSLRVEGSWGPLCSNSISVSRAHFMTQIKTGQKWVSTPRWSALHSAAHAEFVSQGASVWEWFLLKGRLPKLGKLGRGKKFPQQASSSTKQAEKGALRAELPLVR